MAFDPSTAKLIKFDPSTAKLVSQKDNRQPRGFTPGKGIQEGVSTPKRPDLFQFSEGAIAGIEEIAPMLSAGALDGMDALGKMLGGTVSEGLRTPLQKKEPKTKAGKVSRIIGTYLPVEGAIAGISQYPKVGPTKFELGAGSVFAKAKSPLAKIAKPIIESKAARGTLEHVRKVKKDLKFVTKETKKKIDLGIDKATETFQVIKNQTDDLIKSFETKKLNVASDVKRRKAIELARHKASQLGKETDILNKMDNVESFAYKIKEQLQTSLDESEQLIKGKFNKEYGVILGDGFGNEVVNPKAIENVVDGLYRTLDIPASTSDTLSGKMAKIIKQLDIGDEESKKTVEVLLKALEKSPNLTVQQVHWFKQALNESADSLFRKASDKDAGIALRKTTQGLVDAIDETIAAANPKSGIKYSDTSKRYATFMEDKRIIDSDIGKVEIFREEPIRKGTKALFSDIEKAAQGGADMQNKFFLAQEDRIRTLYRQADLLKENGFSQESEAIYDLSNDLYKLFYSKEKMNRGLKALKEIGKEEPIVLKAIQEGSEKSFLEIGAEIGKLEKAKKLAMRQRDEIVKVLEKKKSQLSVGDLYSVRNLDLEIDALQKKIISDDKGVVPAVLNIFGQFVGSKSRILFGASDAVQGIEGSVKWGALGANSALNAIDGIGRFITKRAANAPKNQGAVMLMYVKGLQKVKEDISKEEKK